MDSLLDRLAKLPPKRLALLAAELQERVTALERSAREPIAVIGMGCRLPGGVHSPAEFWQLLAAGRDAIEPTPAERIKPGSTAIPGGYVAGIDQFDAAFFGISPREATSIDPQHRLLLEVAWEALEQAGQAPAKLAGTRTGVWVGVSTNDYALLLGELPEEQFDVYSGSGVARSVAAGRISYTLGLQGPSLAIDTACSSSSVAIHLAGQSLRSRECNLALAGGVNALLLPQTTRTLETSRMLAPDGRCKAFAAEADGFVRAEGCGLLVLKRLSDALTDRDRIVGVIRGTACNQDGRSNGLTAPNGPAQEIVLRAALENAGLTPDDIDYIEAHGTGTALGDPIEAGALAAVFAPGRRMDRPLWLGSVKTNVGHLEAAAGVTGVIKTLLALEHRQIPPHLHAAHRNPRIPWATLPLAIPDHGVPWPASSTRAAGVSSFGFSGTNAHIVLTEAPAPGPVTRGTRPWHVLTLSAKSRSALDVLRQRYQAAAADGETPFADLCYTSNAGRNHFPHRLAVVASATAEAHKELSDPAAVYAHVESHRAPEIALLFTGQGAQYAGMGRQLYEHAPVFRAVLDRCEQQLPGLLDVLWNSANSDLLDDTAWTQPALFACEVALTELWRSWGIVASVVLGHSVGEFAAACVAGVFSLEDGLRLTRARGQLMSALPRNGAMIAISAPESDVAAAIAPFADRLAIAVLNGPEDVVISGETTAAEVVAREFAERGIATRGLKVSHALHSPLLDPMLDELERVAHSITYAAPQIPWVSNVTGQLRTEAPDARYWREHARRAVQFAASCQTLLAQNCQAAIEIGPAPVLLNLLRKNAAPASLPPLLPSLRPGHDHEEWRTLLGSLAQVYRLGVEINWEAVAQGQNPSKAVLPTYPFERTRYWLGSGEGSSTPDESARWLYEPDWEPLPPAPAPADVIASVSLTPEAPGEAAFSPALNSLCRDYILAALQQCLHQSWEPGLRLTPETLGVIPAQQRLLARLCETLVQNHVLEHEAISGDVWIVCDQRAPAQPERHWQELREQFPAHTAELEFVARAAHLADVLQGRREPLDVLFPGGSTAEAERLYRDAPGARRFNEAVATAVRAALPAGQRPLRILEVGAGTGSATAAVLPLLPPGRVAEYVFTDASHLFLERAGRQLAAEYPFVRAVRYDLEQPTLPPDIAPHSFDVVLAANVLHATSSLRRTLRHLREAVRPGGSLVILEGTNAQSFADVTVGMTEGWWTFTDLDLRPEYPLLSRAAWLALLAELGFEAAALPDDAHALQTILVAQARSTANLPRVFLTGGDPAQQALLVGQLQAHGCEIAASVREADATVLLSFTGTARARTLAALNLLQAAATTRAGSPPPQLWLVTQQAQAALLQDEADPAAATVWGLGRGADVEHPELRVRCVDLSAQPEFAALAKLIAHGTAEPNLILRGAQQYGLRLRASQPPLRERRLALNPQGAYLITGAFGGLGTALTRWLAERGAGELVLVGRHAPGSAAEAAQQEAKRLGTRVHVVVADVAEEAAVAAAFARATAPLRGIIHAAGTVADALALSQTAGHIDAVFAAKVDAAWHLHRASLALPDLDFFVLFGSAASVLGSPGQINHAAANAFLDALAQHRRYHRLPALTIAWGPWSEIGAAAGKTDQARAIARGVGAIAPAQGLALLESLMTTAGTTTQAAVLPIDWSLYLAPGSPHAHWPMLAGLRPASRAAVPALLTAQPTAPAAADSSSSDLAARLETASPRERRPLLIDHLRGRLSAVLRLPVGTDTIAGDQPLSELGLDSLMALELKNELQSALGILLPATLFFEYPTLDAVSLYLDAALIGRLAPVTTAELEPAYEQIAL